MILFAFPSLLGLVFMACLATAEAWRGGRRWEYQGPERRRRPRVAFYRAVMYELANGDPDDVAPPIFVSALVLAAEICRWIKIAIGL